MTVQMIAALVLLVVGTAMATWGIHSEILRRRQRRNFVVRITADTTVFRNELREATAEVDRLREHLARLPPPEERP